MSDRPEAPVAPVEAYEPPYYVAVFTTVRTQDQSGYSGTNYNLSYFQQFNNPSNAGMFFPFVNPNFYPLIDGNGLHLPAGVQSYRAPATVTNALQSFTQELRLQSDDPNARFVWTAGLSSGVHR